MRYNNISQAKNKSLNYENLAFKETQRRLNQDKLEQRSTIPRSQNPALQPVLRLATLWIPENNNTTTTWARNLAGLPKFVSATYRINHTGKNHRRNTRRLELLQHMMRPSRPKASTRERCGRNKTCGAHAVEVESDTERNGQRVYI